MNLLGPELVRDLVSLIQRAEADAACKVLVFTSARPGLLHLACRSHPRRGVPGRGGEADRRSLHRCPLPAISARVALSPSRRSGVASAARERVRPGVRHALRRARIGDLRSDRAGVRSDSRRGTVQYLVRVMGRARALEVLLSSDDYDAGFRGTIRLDRPSTAGGSARGVRHELALGSPRFRPPATSWSRPGSTLSRSHRPGTSAGIQTCSAPACGTPKPNAGSTPGSSAASRRQTERWPSLRLLLTWVTAEPP